MTEKLLNIHLQEVHDSFFEVLSQRRNMVIFYIFLFKKNKNIIINTFFFIPFLLIFI